MKKKNIFIILIVSLLFISAYWLASYYRLAQVAGVAIQKYVDSPTGPATATEFAVKHVTKKDNGMVEAIAYATTTKCYYPGSARPYGSATDLFRITLAPSTIKGEYVVIEDKRLGDTENPVPYARTLYRSKDKGDPSCS